jgi:hypothetical protein
MRYAWGLLLPGVLVFSLAGCPVLPLPTPITVDSPLYGQWVSVGGQNVTEDLANGVLQWQFYFDLDGTYQFEWHHTEADDSGSEEGVFFFDEATGQLVLMQPPVSDEFQVYFTEKGMKWTPPRYPDAYIVFERPQGA